jgi:hypothetical protein
MVTQTFITEITVVGVGITGGICFGVVVKGAGDVEFVVVIGIGGRRRLKRTDKTRGGKVFLLYWIDLDGCQVDKKSGIVGWVVAVLCSWRRKWDGWLTWIG